MLTVKALIRDGKIEFADDVNLAGDHRVLVTFLESDTLSILFPDHEHEEAAKLLGNLRFGLTERELDVLKFAQSGLTNEQIAEKLEIGHGTVRNYLSSVYGKLKVNNRTGAISRAIEEGLLE